MSDWFSEAAARLAGEPWLQALLAALATFVLEDPTTIGAGLLVADGKMSFVTALAGVSIGIAVGDVGLYGLGRLCGPWVERRGWIAAERLERASGWFERNLVLALVVSRFVPGMRFPTFVGAGLLRASFLRFVVVAAAASLVWTFLLLQLTIALGEAVFPLLGRFRWPVAGAALLLLLLAQRRAMRSLSRRPGPAPEVSAFEFWPPWLFYIPVGVYYAWLSLRFRGWLLPTAANPSIHAGGLIGESKAEVLGLVPKALDRFVADWTTYRRPAGGEPAHRLAEAEEAMAAAGLSYPLVAKPDLGQRGAGIQLIRKPEQLADYLGAFPADATVMLQRLAGAAAGAADERGLLPLREAGVMYWRLPGEARGRIPSMTLKYTPALTGDGRTTLGRLLQRDPRASRILPLYRRRLGEALSAVPAAGEVVPLVFAGNHCQGTVFRDGTDRVTPALVERFEEIARAMDDFWFGRFDVRFDDFEAFLAGDAFQIIEINGAGAEATHIWDAGQTLGQAYGTLFEQWRTLFVIGAANRRRGVRPLSAARFLRDVRRYRKLAAEYPATH